jgi:hypothetical protein
MVRVKDGIARGFAFNHFAVTIDDGLAACRRRAAS